MSFTINWVPKKPINTELVDFYMKKSIESNQFTNNGPNVQELESFIKRKFNIIDKSVICVCNGSAALHGLVSGIEYYHSTTYQWATQSFTFPPSAQGSLSNAHIIDIDQGGGLNLELLDDSIDGIIVTNVFGNVVDIEKYVNWSEENNKFLIFDNAATPITDYKGINCCNYGTGSIISFHHTKPLGFGEGGAIIVDPKYEFSICRIINFGLKPGSMVPWDRRGSNYKMSEIAAVYILQYLVEYQRIFDQHCKLYRYLQSKLDEKSLKIRLYPNFSQKDPCLSCFSLMFDNYDDNIRLQLLGSGIFCRKYYKPLDNSPVAHQFYSQILCIPCTVDMTESDIDKIINLIVLVL